MVQHEAAAGSGNVIEDAKLNQTGVDDAPAETPAQINEEGSTQAVENGVAEADSDNQAAEWNNEEHPPMMTRVGVEYRDGQKSMYQDWSLRDVEPTFQSQLAGLFDITVALNGDITLLSPFLVNTFREVVKYFPGTLNDSATFIVIGKPYAALYHYWADLRAAIEAQLEDGDEGRDEKMAEENNKDESPEKQEIRLHLERLSIVYEEFCATDHSAARELVQNNLITFKALWALYKPGELVLSKDQFGEPVLHSFTACAIRSSVNIKMMMTSFETLSGGESLKGPETWNVDGWCIQWDGSTRRFTRYLKTFVVDSFPGARTITSIEPSPLRFHDDLYEGHDLATMLKDRGEKWRKLIALPPICQMYHGPAFRIKVGTNDVTKDRTNLHDRVIVHHDGYNEFRHEDPKLDAVPEGLNPMMDMISGMFKRSDGMPVIISGYDDRFVQYDQYPPEKDFDDLQTMASPSVIVVYSITTRYWYQITVGLLQDVKWRTSALDGLVLEKSTKDMIHALVAQHKDSRGHFLDDFIEGKGQGLVIVLHGNPGVGKTLTAESVAEFTQKPLIAINIGEMSVEDNVERRLKTVFRQASVWDAVLLLDEADVVLEERSYEDMKRNAIVSVFLRMVEYYPGILFMTTNRIRTMDNAFQSRIHMAVQYDDLNKAARRRIWKNLIDRLPEADRDELEPSLSDLAGWKLNGRQIRNIFLVAQSVALKENKPLAYGHVKQIIRKTLDFQHFFRDAHEAVRTNLGTNWRNPSDYKTSGKDLDRELDGRDRELTIRDRARDRINKKRDRRDISRDGDDDRDEDSDYEERDRERERRKVERSQW